MASVFISHSSRDRATTEWVAEKLRAAGFAALFVDFDPEQGIPAGRNWERELYAQLRRSDAVVFLASEVSVASSWCLLEVGLARSLGRPVFPVRLQPGVALPLLADVRLHAPGRRPRRSKRETPGRQNGNLLCGPGRRPSVTGVSSRPTGAPGRSTRFLWR